MKITSNSILFATLLLLSVLVIKDSDFFIFLTENISFELRLLNKNSNNIEQNILVKELDSVVKPNEENLLKKNQKLSLFEEDETEEEIKQKELDLLLKEIEDVSLNNELNFYEKKIEKDRHKSNYLRENFFKEVRLHFKELKLIPEVDRLNPDDLILQKYFDLLNEELNVISSRTDYNEVLKPAKWSYKNYFRVAYTPEELKTRGVYTRLKKMEFYLEDLNFKTGFRQVNKKFQEMSGDRHYVEPDEEEIEIEEPKEKPEPFPPEKVTYLEFMIDSFFSLSDKVLILKKSIFDIIKSLLIKPSKKMPFRESLSLLEKKDLKEKLDVLEQEYKETEHIMMLKRIGVFDYPIDSIPPDKTVMDEFQYETRRRIPDEASFYLSENELNKTMNLKKVIVKDHFKRALKLVRETPTDLDLDTIKHITKIRSKELKPQINISLKEVLESTRRTFNTEVLLDQNPPDVEFKLMQKQVLMEQHIKLVKRMLVDKVLFEKDLFFLEKYLFNEYYLAHDILEDQTIKLRESNVSLNVDLISNLLYKEHYLENILQVEKTLEEEFNDFFYDEIVTKKAILAKSWTDEYYKTKKDPFLDSNKGFSNIQMYSLFALIYFTLILLILFLMFS